MHPKLMDWEGERVPKNNEIWMLACIKNSLKNSWFRRPKFKKITNKTIPQTMYFLLAILNRFWRGLGRVLGEVWDLLGVSWSTFKRLFSRLCCQEGPRGSKKRPRDFLGSIWDGFGEVLGRFWKLLGVSWDTFMLFFARLFCQEGPRGSKRRPRGLLGSIP